MSKSILMEEFHLTVFAPAGLRPEAYRAICRTLDDARFRAALRRAIHSVLGKYSSLSKVRSHLTR